MNALGLLTRFGLTKPPTGGGGGVPTNLIMDEVPANDLAISTAAFRGWEFTLDAAAEMTAFRWYGGLGSSTTTAVLWRVSDQSIVAQAKFDATSNPNEWNEVAITPVALGAGVNYIIGVARTSADGTNPSHEGHSVPGDITLGDGVTYVQGRTRPSYNASLTFPTGTSTDIWLVDAVFTV